MRGRLLWLNWLSGLRSTSQLPASCCRCANSVATTTTALLSSLFRLNADLVSADFAESAAGMPGMPKGAVFGGGVSSATNARLLGVWMCEVGLYGFVFFCGSDWLCGFCDQLGLSRRSIFLTRTTAASVPWGGHGAWSGLFRTGSASDGRPA